MDKPDVINLLVQVIRSCLKFENDQVVVYNQGWKIPDDKRTYVSVALLSSKPFGSRRNYKETPDALVEVVTVNSAEVYAIDVFSFNPMLTMADASRVIAAFNSTLAQQVMEEHSFKMPTLPTSFIDVSGVEGASRLTRFRANFPVLRARSHETAVEYYDKFSGPALILNP